MITQKALNGMPKKFSYTNLSNNDRIRVKELEVKIRTSINPRNKNIFEAGNAFIKAKSILPHGQFEIWVDTILEMSHETAQKYMKVTKHFEGKYYFFFKNYSLAALLELTKFSASDLDSIMAGEITIESIKSQQTSKAIVQLKTALPSTSEPTIQDLANQVTQIQQQLSSVHAIERYVIPPEVQEEIEDLKNRLEALSNAHQTVLQANATLSKQNEEMGKKLTKYQTLAQYFMSEHSHIEEGEEVHANQQKQLS